jgi:hypothetical protein
MIPRLADKVLSRILFAWLIVLLLVLNLRVLETLPRGARRFYLTRRG